MREYPVKKGLSTKTDRIKEIVEKYGKNVKIDGNTIIFSMDGLKSVKVICGEKTLNIETETDNTYENPENAIKIYNNFLFEATGFDSKERKKRLSKI
ncbi:DUF5611 family protein [Caldiplasma sukawensis]